MSPFSWPVVLGTIVVSSPALWAAQVSGTLSPDVALLRLLVCLGAVWVAFSVVAMLATRTVQANDLAEDALARAAAELEEAAARAAAAEAAAADAQDGAGEGVGVG
ncbi:hypothetical protein GON03_15610 [Nocardioides sp. MAH-18]|uniref:Uncharacterized protein n=1 Tax=Nocardioides agri TaxID=2682843 RepID=A0A6L6XTA1_9ACTN|nr:MULTISPECIES: hypothetical protein [unclassified Nocardioides]MBA2955761.1 hypothetical protein [Nocardioides sp. CGMCC 1.13656]MVQ50611.1 hypothetical protein [Nocardioides sp. MAH-18]